MYSKKDFENLVNDILSRAGIKDRISLHLLKDQAAKKWYDKSYTADFEHITEDTIYGVKFLDSHCIDYDFKSGKMDSLLKSFLNKYTSRLTAYRQDADGYYKTVSIKSEVLEKIVTANKDRVDIGLFYTTLYGIGMWAIFASNKDRETAKGLGDMLKGKGITYANEWSEAGWVYRFKIGADVHTHNRLLLSFKDTICRA